MKKAKMTKEEKLAYYKAKRGTSKIGWKNAFKFIGIFAGGCVGLFVIAVIVTLAQAK